MAARFDSSVTNSVFAAYFGDPRFTPSVLQQELVNAGFLGRKTGRGFYRYGDDAAKPVAQAEAACDRPAAVKYAGGPGSVDALIARVEAAGIAMTAIEAAPGLYCAGAAIYLTDGRSATERAQADNHRDTIVFDLLLDAASAPRIALARADRCSDDAWCAAVGLFQAAGFVVTCLDDVPGLAVMRTVAMLANEAADAVHQGVCSARAVDIAMQKGVNYPRGPLAWLDAIGMGQVVTVLANLAATYGEDRYRVAPLLRRKLAADPQGARFHV